MQIEKRWKNCALGKHTLRGQNMQEIWQGRLRMEQPVIYGGRGEGKARFLRNQVQKVLLGESEQLYQKLLVSQMRTNLAMWTSLLTQKRVISMEDGWWQSLNGMGSMVIQRRGYGESVYRLFFCEVFAFKELERNGVKR